MCGLILAPARYAHKIETALGAMEYRGADGLGGAAAMGDWVVGHVRLAIQDRTPAGAQPFLGRHNITAFVGEFFTHGGRGEEAYLDKLLLSQDFSGVDGFWSVVRVDQTGAKAYTDHLGIKPLYWWAEKSIVCSELDPMFVLESQPPLDEIYLGNVIKFGYDYSGRTPYQGIRQLPSGSVLNLGGTNASISRYWDWWKIPVDPADLRQTIDEAIANRLIGDREVAMLLSGGLDSSIIYYSLARQGLPVQAFSIENGETEFLPDDVTVMDLDPVPLWAAVGIMQAPLDLGSLVPQIQLARAVARQGFHVCLTGDGADELFGGYRRAADYDSQQSDVFCELPYYHLPRLDRVMMRETIELRSPYLSPKVAASALKLRREDRTAKQALKHAYRDIVPQEILDRKKYPLKTQAVREGGEAYRRQLVKEFRNYVSVCYQSSVSV